MTGIMQMVLAGKKSNQYNWPVANVGDAYGGGYFAGQVTDNGVIYNLIVSPKTSGTISTFGLSGTTTGYTSKISGPTNSAALAALGSPAAAYCEAQTTSGYIDWYLPAQNELETAYYYLKPSTSSNNTSSGSNANAVLPEPISTNYTTALPPQTNSALFKSTGSESFYLAYHLTSTEFDATNSVAQNMGVGAQINQAKSTSTRTRAFRRIPASWPVACIGDSYGGGYFGGQINISGTIYNLVVAPKTTGESSTEIVWGPYTTTSVTSVINGPTNTATLAALGSTYEAATFCNNLNSGGGLNGHTDWYLPAKNELEVLMYYFKPTNTDPNNTSSGSNANAVLPEPISTNYTTALPPQTIASAFVVGGAEAFSAQYYWSSTEANSVSAVSQNINTLNQTSQLKDATHGVRAIRRVLA